jgi:3-oxoacyl-(acyl-carrier-protein) synthase
MVKPVYITGIGMISAIGKEVPTALEALKSLQSGIGPITLFSSLHQDSLPMAEVKFTNDQLKEMAGIPAKEPVTRTSLLGIIAVNEALKSAGLTRGELQRTGLISATTVGGMDKSEQFYADFLENNEAGKLRDVVHHDCGESTERIARNLGINKYISTISTACSSSANAIMTAAALINSGRVDRMIAGGTDSATKFTLNGFNTLMILDKTGCHPFDGNRAGLTLGEGAAYVVLESEEVVLREGKQPLAQVTGYGNANDAYHQTASSPDGTGAFFAMNKAIESAGLKPSDISYINAHGTGTENNDLSEGIAIQRVFGSNVPPFSSTKGYTGHTLGAAGAVEAVISALSLMHQTIFPNIRWSNPMAELEITPVTETVTNSSIRHILSNSFGFGGNNATLIISTPQNLSS